MGGKRKNGRSLALSLPCMKQEAGESCVCGGGERKQKRTIEGIFSICEREGQGSRKQERATEEAGEK